MVRAVPRHLLARQQLAWFGEWLAPRPEKAENDEQAAHPTLALCVRGRAGQEEAVCAQSGLTLKLPSRPHAHHLSLSL